MTLIDFQKVGYRDEPFIIAQQASQVFYVKDPTFEHWFALFMKKKNKLILMKRI